MSAHVLADRLSPGFMRHPLLPRPQTRTDPDGRASLSLRWGAGNPNARQRRDLAPKREGLPVTEWGSSPPHTLWVPPASVLGVPTSRNVVGPGGIQAHRGHFLRPAGFGQSVCVSTRHTADERVP